MYKNEGSEVHKIAVVRGYLFEESFLHFRELSSLSIQAVNANDPSCKSFRFPSLTPALEQQMGALITSLSNNLIYHLRSGHPAIDGVCVAKEVSGQRYLLLLRISLSCYKDHSSKDIHIWESVVSPEKEHRSASVVEYYRNLCFGDIADDHVIYVYVSPKETNAPQRATFNQELSQRIHRGDDLGPLQVWYGFVAGGGMEMMIKQIEAEV